jgi:hypothetical protein
MVISYYASLSSPHLSWNQGPDTIDDVVKKRFLDEFEQRAKMRECELHLTSFLEKRRNTQIEDEVQKDINTALVKLYVKYRRDLLPAFLRQTQHFYANELEPLLLQSNCYVALGHLYRVMQLYRKALKVWQKYLLWFDLLIAVESERRSTTSLDSMAFKKQSICFAKFRPRNLSSSLAVGSSNAIAILQFTSSLRQCESSRSSTTRCSSF